MHMKRTGNIAKVHAFSLIELMVTVAIVGMLSAVAVPSYTSEMTRSRVASLIPLAESVKIDVMEQHSYGVVFGAVAEDQIAAVATDKPKYLDSLVRDVYGCVSINFDTGALGLDAAEVLSLVYCPASDPDSGTVTWSCGYSATTEVDYVTYLPTNCRQVIVADTTF